MQEAAIDFQQCTNAFLKCGNPVRLQQLADSLTTQDLLKCGQKWLAAFTLFFTDKERKHAGCQHRLFFSQVEYCDNLIFHRRAAVDELTERLLDLNRNSSRPVPRAGSDYAARWFARLLCFSSASARYQSSWSEPMGRPR
jgi:hypothetical protein